MGPLLSTRLASSALPMADRARCFYAYYFCGELVKTAPTDTMISNQSINQSINQCSCLVSSLSPSLVSLGGAWRLLLALRCLISDRFCIIPVGSGIEHFFGIMRLCCGFLLAYRAVFPFLFRHRSAWPRCSCRARSCDVIGDVIMMSSGSAGLPACRSVMPPVVLASSFSVRPPLVVSLHRPALRVGGRGADGASCLP